MDKTKSTLFIWLFELPASPTGSRSKPMRMNKSKNKILIGDNYSVMNSHIMDEFMGRVRMIYIDPPYNTGNPMSYSDKSNSEDWLQNISLRISASRKFLTEDGFIFISIDDNEYAYLKVECDQIFGKENFVGTFITNQSKRSNSKLINIVHEYVICYAKNKKMCKTLKMKRMDIPEDAAMIQRLTTAVKQDFNMFGIETATDTLTNIIQIECKNRNITWLKNYNNVDENGDIYFAMDLSTPGKPREVNIPEINLHLEPLPSRGWSSDNKFKELHQMNLLAFKGTRPYEKHYLRDAEDNVSSILPFYSRQGKHNLIQLGIRDIFDTPKPVELIKFLIRVSGCSQDYVMDFYAGSGTTAQAVYEINNEDNKANSYILIQRKESVKPDSLVFSACKNYGIPPFISDILKFRIDRFLNINKMNDNYKIFEIE